MSNRREPSLWPGAILFVVIFALGMAPLNGYVRKPPKSGTTSEPMMMAPTYILPVNPPVTPDARHCTSDELISCACGSRGVKACSVGTIDGHLTTLCECGQGPRPFINPNLQVSNRKAVGADL